MDSKLDKKVLQEFQKGKHAAFEHVFEFYYSKLFFFANRLIETSDEAEDITLVAFQKLFGICSKFETEDNVKAFLYLTVRNSCLSYLRHRKVRTDYQKAFTEKMQNDVLFTFEYGIRDELYSKVQSAIESLPEECRKIFKMIYYEELSPADVAALLQISVNTVYTQRRRAIYALRLLLSENSMAIIWLLQTLACIDSKFAHPAYVIPT